METSTFWKKCNMCKKPIPFGAVYWVCNVSTCNRKRTGLNFCDVACWDAHLPMMNHRESWAEERRAPSREDWAKIQAGEMEEPRTRPARQDSPGETPETSESSPPVRKTPPAPAPAILRKKSR